jgi:hypothetical protein
MGRRYARGAPGYPSGPWPQAGAERGPPVAVDLRQRGAGPDAADVFYAVALSDVARRFCHPRADFLSEPRNEVVFDVQDGLPVSVSEVACTDA